MELLPIDLPQFKLCSKCKIKKLATREFFYKKADGLQSWCKECRQLFCKLPEQKDKSNVERRKRRAVNPEKYRKQDKDRYYTDDDRRKRQIARRSELRKLDPEKYKARDHVQYLKTKDRRIMQAKEWAEKNPERKREIERKIMARKRLDPTFRLRSAISAHINWSLRKKKKKKNGASWEALCGYTLTDLVRHLEFQFLKGMSWKNYGKKWHVDHIVPASIFKYNSPQDEDFKACWALANLRPMWAADNISKNNKRIYLL